MNTPNQCPLARDDDPHYGEGYGRQSDEDWFRGRAGSFRMVSATDTDMMCAGVFPPPPRYRGIRLSMRAHFRARERGPFIVEVVYVPPCDEKWITAASDEQLREYWLILLEAKLHSEPGTMVAYKATSKVVKS